MAAAPTVLAVIPHPDDEVLAMQVLMGWRFNVTVEGREGGAWNGPGHSLIAPVKNLRLGPR